MSDIADMMPKHSRKSRHADISRENVSGRSRLILKSRLTSLHTTYIARVCFVLSDDAIMVSDISMYEVSFPHSFRHLICKRYEPFSRFLWLPATVHLLSKLILFILLEIQGRLYYFCTRITFQLSCAPTLNYVQCKWSTEIRVIFHISNPT